MNVDDEVCKLVHLKESDAVGIAVNEYDFDGVCRIANMYE